MQPALSSILWRYVLPLTLIVLMVSQLDMDDLWDQIRHVNAVYWLVAMLCIFVQNLLNTWRWQMLMNLQTKRLGYTESVHINFLSQAANYLFIASISGVVVRIAMVMRKGISLGRALGANVVDRVFAIFTLVSMVVISVPFVIGLLKAELIFPIAVAFMLVAAVIIGTLVMVWVATQQKMKLPFQRKLRAMLVYGRHLRKHPDIITLNIGLSLGGQLLFFIGTLAMAKALQINHNPIEMLILLPVVSLVSSLPLTVGGWGVREGAFIYAFGLIGIQMEQAFMLSVQVGLAGIAATLMLGLPWGLSLRTRPSIAPSPPASE